MYNLLYGFLVIFLMFDIHKHRCVHIHVNMCIYVCKYIGVCIHRYIYTDMHIHTCKPLLLIFSVMVKK